MTKEAIIRRMIENLSKLPDHKLNEVSEFVEFLLKKHEEEIIQKGIQTLVSQSQTYQFLENEEDLYSVNDIKEKYQ